MNEILANQKELVVVKLGSSSVSSPETGMDMAKLSHCAEQIADLMMDYEVLLVCSGSINTGKSMWRDKKPLARDQDYAAIGSARNFIAVNEAFQGCGVETAQIMVTNHEIDSVEGYNYQESLRSLSTQGILPVINGNDSLSKIGVQEYKIDTDNDVLAGHTAGLTMASYLMLLTDAPGLKDGDNVVKEVDVSEPRQVRYALSLTPRVHQSGLSRGGMRSKVTVAKDAAMQNAEAYIASATADLRGVLARDSGTRFFDSQFSWRHARET